MQINWDNFLSDKNFIIIIVLFQLLKELIEEKALKITSLSVTDRNYELKNDYRNEIHRSEQINKDEIVKI